MIIRETGADEREQVLALYPLAFSDQDLQPVTGALLDEATGVLSLAGFEGDDLTAHVLFSDCETVAGAGGGALLGPLGVVPSHQRCGAGTALVREGLERLEKRGVRQVFVLGDPAYYGRFGFRAERDVKTPCSIPDKWADAWQSLTLGADARLPDGSLQVLRPWRDAALWR